jgi:hypothetical protein
MNKYGNSALRAVKLFTVSQVPTPQDAWEMATIAIFGAGTSGQKKGCPKGAFLGLCEEGLVKGIPRGIYTISAKNKGYAVRAISLLKRDPSYCSNIAGLWNAVIGGVEKKHNSQMDVVLALWNSKLIA